MDQKLYETQKYNGYNINIYYDSDPQHPREDWDNLGTLYTRHRNMRPKEDFDKHFEIEEVFANDSFSLHYSLFCLPTEILLLISFYWATLQRFDLQLLISILHILCSHHSKHKLIDLPPFSLEC